MTNSAICTKQSTPEDKADAETTSMLTSATIRTSDASNSQLSTADAVKSRRHGRKKTELSAEELENKRQRSLELRRKRNRESMQRARMRERVYMDDIREQAAQLEQTYNRFLHQTKTSTMTAEQQAAMVSCKQLWDRYEAARALSASLIEKNRTLQQEIVRRIKGEDRVEGLLREMLLEQHKRIEHDVYFRDMLFSEPGMLQCIGEHQATDVIIASRNEKLFIDRIGFNSPDCIAVELFGWMTKRRSMGKYLHVSFTKLFRHHRAIDVMQRTWNNELRLVSYRNAAQRAHQRLEIMRQFNDDTYMLARDMPDPDGTMVRMAYLRFRLHEPDESFVVAVQSIDEALCALVQNPLKQRVWANELCQWQVFTPVYEHSVDERGVVQIMEHCQVHVLGKVAFGDMKSSERNALETALGLLRWENLNIGPMLVLTPE